MTQKEIADLVSVAKTAREPSEKVMARALETERNRIYDLLCFHCRDGNIPEPKIDNTRWLHRYGNKLGSLAECKASALRAYFAAEEKQ